MKRSARLTLGLALGLAASGPASAQDARFDVQAFRPVGAPRDLVIVGQSRPMGDYDPSRPLELDKSIAVSGGAFFNLALDPLTLVAAGTHSKAVSVVGNRLQLDVMASVGLFGWAELGVDMPLVLAQAGDNLEAIGTEGFIKSFTPGDLRLNGKVAVPYLRRSKPEDAGFGSALTFGMGLPTGLQEAFAGDGAVTGNLGLILDYRFESGALLALNSGLWLRPDYEFAGVQWGSSATFGLGAELPLIRGWGINAVGMLSGSTPLKKLPEDPRQIPAELLVGLRWYNTALGLHVTVGGGGGCGCSLTAPTMRLFTSILWAPGPETAAIKRYIDPPEPPPPPPPPVDPDGDSVIGEGDRCPGSAGPVENGGCPDTDQDSDGVVDRLDRCVAHPAGPRGREGCPLARIDGNKIVILDQVHFATDQDVILPESFPILEEVAEELLKHLEIQRVLVEAHTDARATEAYNYDLSRRRAASVMNFLLDSGIAVERLCSAGFGRSRPLAANDSESNMALNRRVEFTIMPPTEGSLLPPCPPDPAAEQALPAIKPTKGKR
ncbi:outer membrane protein OmpA-like peptidoglycan-associated protein [Archangium gephyra]|uniref:Flagellar motor rotation protein MotB n=1 Tax=Archangium gephyra TaxID=48 RepID=A0AAC8QJ07_9BACT|nr:outer membrane exchange protein TraB [Archangium gephyra]AKJ07986.1 Flagellar motor rotation protein MotB [Archangium gephyra]REG29729.1 outer membrane protein OmpA-like peptidoglycan-associated protein [Archangium gephyra]